MQNIKSLPLRVFVISLMLCTSLLRAQQPANPPPADPDVDCSQTASDFFAKRIQDHVFAKLKEETGVAVADASDKEGLAQAILALAVKQPLTSPSSKQNNAPANVDSALNIVNGAGFSEILAFAIDSGLLSENGDQITGNFNLFDAKAVFQPEAIDRQSVYSDPTNEKLRRWGLGLTFGGKGDSFDRDGDGKDDPALDAKNPEDIVNWEVRYRFHGTRDRRDATNVKNFEMDSLIDKLFRDLDSVRHDLDSKIRGTLVPVNDQFCFRKSKALDLLVDPEFQAQLAAIEDKLVNLQAALDALNKEIDGSLIITAVLGGLDRKPDFGPDKRMAGLRLAKGMGPGKGLTFNAEYTEIRMPQAEQNPNQWKFGAEYSLLALKNTSIGGKDGITVALSGAYELYDHVPSASHDSIGKLNAKLEFPVNDTVKIPISVTWANHKDLLTDEENIQGHIGFTVDLSKLGVKK